ncbi:hypothetical protein T9A_00134 [Alcanivorax jadensis T9]|uniref:Uncharacterized protein n=1 Tax=Alcanivorax jadensis T9 TaxID=1177181 RepID=A0ABR4WGS7_9GAMM|nr:hypothetical protein [Alcanivorax jadensis]KGD62814.1 hypothetical protein T9A_00134 [Alcanivorax jadensis T9]
MNESKSNDSDIKHITQYAEEHGFKVLIDDYRTRSGKDLKWLMENACIYPECKRPPWLLKTIGAGSDFDALILRSIHDAALLVWITKNEIVDNKIPPEFTYASDYLAQALNSLRAGTYLKSLPDIERGEKQIESSSRGGDAAAERHRKKWPEYQSHIDNLYAENPRLSYADLQRKAAIKFEVSEKTIKRHTTNPRTGK